MAIKLHDLQPNDGSHKRAPSARPGGSAARAARPQAAA